MVSLGVFLGYGIGGAKGDLEMAGPVVERGGLDTLVVWKAFFALLLEHKAPEVDVGDVDRWVGGLGRHGRRMERSRKR